MSLEVTNDVPAVFVRLDGERPRGLADVVHCPERPQAGRERFSGGSHQKKYKIMKFTFQEGGVNNNVIFHSFLK